MLILQHRHYTDLCRAASVLFSYVCNDWVLQELLWIGLPSESETEQMKKRQAWCWYTAIKLRGCRSAKAHYCKITEPFALKWCRVPWDLVRFNIDKDIQSSNFWCVTVPTDIKHYKDITWKQMKCFCKLLLSNQYCDVCHWFIHDKPLLAHSWCMYFLFTFTFYKGEDLATGSCTVLITQWQWPNKFCC